MESLLILFIISMLIVFHEFAHLLVAKRYNLYVPEFSIGFGPKIFSFKTKETHYNFRIFLLGGYVAIANNEEETFKDVDQKRKIESLKGYQKSLLAFSGPFANLIISFLFTFLFFFINRKLDLSVWAETIGEMGRFLGQMNTFFVRLFTLQINLDEVGGPIAIINQGVKIAQKNPAYILNWISFISFNLAYANMLPLPPFDGFKFWEGVYSQITKRPISKRFQKIFALIAYGLIIFILIVSFNDIRKLFF